MHILSTPLLPTTQCILKKNKKRGERCIKLVVKYHSILCIVILPMEIKYSAFK